jgi:hypothetical protein
MEPTATSIAPLNIIITNFERRLSELSFSCILWKSGRGLERVKIIKIMMDISRLPIEALGTLSSKLSYVLTNALKQHP